jgi:2'-5' RNA ligase
MDAAPQFGAASPYFRGGRINSFALVTYIPDPLARFLDDLRRELVPSCYLHAHVTVLPPRPLRVSPAVGWDAICSAARNFKPFDLELGEIEIFPVSDVIFIGVRAGGENLRAMHDALNREGLEYAEPFPYHPHVTVAQNLQPDQLDEFYDVAQRRWKEYAGPRSFRVERVTFVQNTRRDIWLDLAECGLGTREVHRMEPLLA